MKHKHAKTVCPPPGERPEAPGLLTFAVKQVALLRAPLLAEPEERETLLSLAMVILTFSDLS